MEKAMKKTNLDIDNVEKMLIKNLESKKRNKNNSNKNTENVGEKPLNIEDFSKEIVDYNKSIPEDNQILFHFDRKFLKDDLEKITSFSSNKGAHFKHSLKMYNQKIGEFNYTYFDPKKSNKASNSNAANNKSETSNLFNFKPQTFFLIFVFCFFKIELIKNQIIFLFFLVLLKIKTSSQKKILTLLLNKYAQT